MKSSDFESVKLAKRVVEKQMEFYNLMMDTKTSGTLPPAAKRISDARSGEPEHSAQSYRDLARVIQSQADLIAALQARVRELECN